ncbi:putative transcription factor interactor and regulator CCHC(Zn) family [Helianthus annuus]|nr:putative transcription factor interactor and regulator CCHC(Zn) family [Helianthus annuus]
MKNNEQHQKKETRTCFQCKTFGHIARNCLKAIQTKQGVSDKLKEKVVEKTKPPTKKFKVFEISIFEVGECSKGFYKRKVNLNNQKWVVKKSDVSSEDESDSSKSEESCSGDESNSLKLDEPQVELKMDISVPPLDDENFPPLRAENLKSKIGKVEISNQFFPEKKEFDVEKAFNPKVKHIFGKMVDGKVKGVKEFYELKRVNQMKMVHPCSYRHGIEPIKSKILTCQSSQVGNRGA